MSNDHSKQIQQQVQAAYESCTPLNIVGGNSKAFYARQVEGEELSTAEHCGVLKYEPTELVITARAGTPLQEVQNTLDEKHQMFGFEPPMFDESATLGGTIAGNFSGPRRAYAGAARDFVLGCKIINGKGEIISFGGEVMKNVAGYDVSRLMVGALGTLGVLLEVSLKVLPKPQKEQTLILECSEDQAIEYFHQWAQEPLPISATCFADSQLLVRLSGSENAVAASAQRIGGETLVESKEFWRILKEQKLQFFRSEKTLWRLSLASDTPPLAIEGEWLWEWGGAQRWLSSDVSPEVVRASAQEFGGHAVAFRNAPATTEIFHPLGTGLLQIHKNLKLAFDPNNILNPGKLYSDL